MERPTDLLRALARRSRSAPSVSPLETEIRSQGAPNFKTEASAEVQEKFPTIASWEWNYGVPLTDIEDFIEFLREKELRIVERMKEVCNQLGDQLIDYRGTFISATGERGWYECRTVWAYRGEQPTAQWADLLADGEFLKLFQGLRKRWANDPTATERLMSLLMLYTWDDDFVDPDYGDVAAGQRAIMEATALVSDED